MLVQFGSVERCIAFAPMTAQERLECGLRTVSLLMSFWVGEMSRRLQFSLQSKGAQALQGLMFLMFHVSERAPPLLAFLVSLRVPLS